MRSLTILFSILWISVLNAQDTEPCGAGVIHDNLLQNDTMYQRSWFNFEQRMLAMRAERNAERNDEIYTIPVVIHVIHEGEAIGQGSNISDEQIFSAMTALNEDFRKMAGTNGDGDGVDCNLEFCLAARDPDGNPSNGINRVDGSVIPLYADEGIQANGEEGADEEDVKSLSVWPREDYMNVWVVNEIENNNAQSGIQGFAYFPINNIIDGIIILHNAIGTTGNIKPNTALNRTLTHEVGHYLGLYHTFHSTNECGEEISCSTQGDRVCDTPPTILSGSCANPACDGTQQVENYMDYTSESCRDMFTQGQKERMRATLLSDRASLLESLGCLSVNDVDAGISSVASPSGSSCSGAFVPEVYITNYGSNTLTSADIYYNVDNAGTQSIQWTGNLETGESVLVTLPESSAGGGSHEFHAWTENPNGQNDENQENDASSSIFTISSGAGAILTVTVDYFGSETTWEVMDGNEVVASGGPYVNNDQGAEFVENICISEGCYSLWMYDAYGDGMGFTNGSYLLEDSEGNELASGGGNYGTEIEHEFCIENNTTEEAPVASFAVSNNEGCGTVEADFSDQSAGTPTSWSWSFPGGSPSSSSSPNPQNITYDSPGTYTVTLTVSNGAGSDEQTMTNIIEVTEGPTVALNANEPSCHGSTDGSISANVSGDGPFEYEWSTGHSNTSISLLSAGEYSITVTDSNGCEVEQSVSLNDPQEITVSISKEDISCFGLNDGTAEVNANGGTGQLSFEWDNGETDESLSGLSSGNVSVEVTDSNGCAQSASISINEPSALALSVLDNDISCDGAPGSASADISGGTSPFSYDWSTGDNSESISDLNEGDYDLTITDANGCEVESSFEITASESLNLNLTVEPISCAGMSDGSAGIDVTGGTGNYTYEWSTGHTYLGISGRGPGDYWISVVDDQGCEGYEEFSLVDPEVLTLNVFKSDVTCHGLDDGEATASGNGGTGALAYYWDNGENGNTISHLSAGSYEVQLMDAHGCIESESIQIVEPSAITGTALMSAPETCAGLDGGAVINPMGGTGDLTILWSNGQTGQELTNVGAGIYGAEITDSNGCSYATAVTISYDCIEAPDPTTLAEEYCGMTGALLDQAIYCVPVENASMYNWRFVNAANGLFAEEYTAGNNPSFLLSNVMNLHYAMNVEVSVRVMNDQEIWSDWGPICVFDMSPEVPTTQLSESDCAMENIVVGSIVSAGAVSGADTYEWEFSSENETVVITTFMNQVTLDLTSGLTEGENYEVRVRSKVGDQWSPWGEICQIIFGTENSIQNIENQDISIMLWPNPSNGENISLQFRNLPEGSHVIEFGVYDGSGKLIENNTLSIRSEQPELTNIFQNKLSAGVYFLQIRLDTQVYEEKLMIR